MLGGFFIGIVELLRRRRASRRTPAGRLRLLAAHPRPRPSRRDPRPGGSGEGVKGVARPAPKGAEGSAKGSAGRSLGALAAGLAPLAAGSSSALRSTSWSRADRALPLQGSDDDRRQPRPRGVAHDGQRIHGAVLDRPRGFMAVGGYSQAPSRTTPRSRSVGIQLRHGRRISAASRLPPQKGDAHAGGTFCFFGALLARAAGSRGGPRRRPRRAAPRSGLRGTISRS